MKISDCDPCGIGFDSTQPLSEQQLRVVLLRALIHDATVSNCTINPDLQDQLDEYVKQLMGMDNGFESLIEEESLEVYRDILLESWQQHIERYSQS